MSLPSELELAPLRMDYRMATLSRSDVDPDPIKQFEKWFQEAQTSKITEPNALVLATADADGTPSSRTVLLKAIDHRGLSFFTNYDSQKGKELAANPKASATFLWLDLERQIHIRGAVEKVSEQESEDYFRMRPWKSQIGAVASFQSECIPNRGWLEERFEDLKAQFPEGHPIPRPSNWGGYRLIPQVMEFWQGRQSRLHDRIVYQRTKGGWEIERLSP